jgi:hypothetical protein
MSAQDSPHLILVIWDDGGGEVSTYSANLYESSLTYSFDGPR